MSVYERTAVGVRPTIRVTVSSIGRQGVGGGRSFAGELRSAHFLGARSMSVRTPGHPRDRWNASKVLRLRCETRWLHDTRNRTQIRSTWGETSERRAAGRSAARGVFFALGTRIMHGFERGGVPGVDQTKGGGSDRSRSASSGVPFREAGRSPCPARCRLRQRRDVSGSANERHERF
ncbi:MAG: hypothetical protein D6725_04015 [Planctomycetota bacterium]|nr:MAG: hypothetical protein D6725_04015 [Planctomycetota bacterium]